MPASKNPDLHGNVPDSSPVAVLLIDVINDLEFEGGEELLANALPMARQVAALRRDAKRLGVPVVYVNDNYGQWQSDFRKLVDHCVYADVRGKQIAQLLAPGEDDYFVLKPKHSGFYATTLDTLLVYLKCTSLVLAGLTGNVCVLFTAHDAFMRDFDLWIPSDCTASIDATENEQALAHAAKVLRARTTPYQELDLERFLACR
ncbi:MAG TPA: isochorismatase family cysteine hydrolase [Kofleriaceae bacterium]|nr:isochorismatase family cysteine hydrolase [Kofleriaceae bacterium]